MIWTLTGVASPAKSLFGVNVIVLLALSNSYLPWGVVTLVTSSPASFNNVNVSGFNSALSPLGPCSIPLLKLTVFPLSSPVSSVSSTINEVCGLPCTSLVVELSAVGFTGTISGLYVAFEVIVAGSFFSFVTVTVASTSIAGTSPV